jgi:hypothetical protein
MDRVHAINDEDGGSLANQSGALSAIDAADVGDGAGAHPRRRRCCDFAGEWQRACQLERTRDDRGSVGGRRRGHRTEGSRWSAAAATLPEPVQAPPARPAPPGQPAPPAPPALTANRLKAPAARAPRAQSKARQVTLPAAAAPVKPSAHKAAAEPVDRRARDPRAARRPRHQK